MLAVTSMRMIRRFLHLRAVALGSRLLVALLFLSGCALPDGRVATSWDEVIPSPTATAIPTASIGAAPQFTPTPQPAPSPAEPFIRQGIVLRDAGDLEGSLVMLHAAVTADPRNPMVYVERGYTYLMADDSAAAYDDAQRALALAPTNLDALSLGSTSLAYLGDFEGAIALTNQGIDLLVVNGPQSRLADAYYTRASFEEALCDLGAALADLQQTVKINPWHAGAQVRLGIYLQSVPAYQAAWDAWQSQAPTDPTPAQAAYGEGMELLLRSRIFGCPTVLEQAGEAFTRAIATDPDWALPYVGRAQAAIGAPPAPDLDRWAFENALEGETGIVTRTHLATGDYWVADWAEIVAYRAEIAGTAPDHVLAAAADLQTALAIDPMLVDALNDYAALIYYYGDVVLRPETAGDIYYVGGLWEGYVSAAAAQYLGRAEELDPTNPFIRHNHMVAEMAYAWNLLDEESPDLDRFAKSLTAAHNDADQLLAAAGQSGDAVDGWAYYVRALAGYFEALLAGRTPDEAAVDAEAMRAFALLPNCSMVDTVSDLVGQVWYSGGYDYTAVPRTSLIMDGDHFVYTNADAGLSWALPEPQWDHYLSTTQSDNSLFLRQVNAGQLLALVVVDADANQAAMLQDGDWFNGWVKPIMPWLMLLPTRLTSQYGDIWQAYDLQSDTTYGFLVMPDQLITLISRLGPTSPSSAEQLVASFEQLELMAAARVPYAPTLYHVALDAWHGGNAAATCAAIDEAIGIDPTVAEYFNLRALCRTALGDPTAALADLVQYADLADELTPAVLDTRAYAYLKLDDYAAALADYEEVAKQGDASSVYQMLGKGVALAKLGRLEEARVTLDMAMILVDTLHPAHAPRDPELSDLVGWAMALLDAMGESSGVTSPIDFTPHAPVLPPRPS